MTPNNFARLRRSSVIRYTLDQYLRGCCLISRHVNVPPQSDGSEYHSKFHPSLATLLRLYRVPLDALGIGAQYTFRNVTTTPRALSRIPAVL